MKLELISSMALFKVTKKNMKNVDGKTGIHTG